MSILVNGACPALLTSLKVNNILTPDKLATTPGLVGALESPENNSVGLEIKAGVNPQGHERQIRVMYKQSPTVDDVEEGRSCDPGEENPYLETDVTLDHEIERRFQVDASTVRHLCEEYSQIVTLTGANPTSGALQSNLNRFAGNVGAMREIADELERQFPAILDKINRLSGEDLETKVGTYVGGASTKTYVVQKSAASGGDPNTVGLTDFYTDLAQIGYAGMPHVVHGYGPLYKMVATGQLNGFCCQLGGTNPQEMFGNYRFMSVLDRNVVNYLGAENKALIISKGSAVMVPWLYNKGNFGGFYDNTLFMTIPLSGVPNVTLDLRIVETACGANNQPVFDFILNLKWGIFTQPDDLYKSSDYRAGVNGILLANFTQAT